MAITQPLKSILLIPSQKYFLMALFSGAILVFLFVSKGLSMIGDWALVAMVGLALFGCFPLAFSPYRLVSGKDRYVLIYPFGRSKSIQKNGIRSVDEFWSNLSCHGVAIHASHGTMNIWNVSKVNAFLKRDIKSARRH